jgi:alkanesulfonate monooxygenase SsuD/methylene tetrahydromethanopterin reductase-like flavin-dependent oxidoreductase (luciferase family)
MSSPVPVHRAGDTVPRVSVKRGIFAAPFDELVDPRTLADLASAAEDRGWDGFFVWDHIRYREPARAVADPWVALSAIALATERLRIGPMVTPLSRRRVHKLARETVTLDHLSRGRLVLGVGLGSDLNNELEPFGEVTDPRERARLLDDGLARLTQFWSGEFEPPPVQRPRIPVWAAARWPNVSGRRMGEKPATGARRERARLVSNRRPLRRAARWDGLFPIELPGPEALAALVEEVREMRGGTQEPFDFVAEISPGDPVEPWEAVGATWVLTGFDFTPKLDEVREAIEAGPA